MEAVFKKVLDHLGISEETANNDLEIVKKWCQSQPHLPEVMSDFQIRNFLVLNKHSIERTKQKIDMYYTIRSLIPEIYDDCNPRAQHITKVFETTYFGVYPVLMQELSTVHFYKFKNTNSVAPREIVSLVIAYGEIRQHESCSISDIHIVDMDNVTFNDMTKITPSLILRAVAIYEKVFSLRVKAVYVVNALSYVSTVLRMLKKVVKPKIFNRIHLCDNTEILKEVFTEETLPKDYGGRGPSLQEITDATKRKLEEYQDRFDLLDKMRVDESLRPQKLSNDEVLGFYGNFKKLDLD